MYKTPDVSITLDESKALKDAKGKPIKWGKEGKPSEANHGNVTPSLVNDKTKTPNHGGVTMRYAEQSMILSLPALRRLQFPDAAGGASTPARNQAAHAVLAALGLAATALSISQGCDLRSRCLLIPDASQPAQWEVIDPDGRPTPFSLGSEAACALLNAAIEAATKAGLRWRREQLDLKAAEGLLALVRKTQELAVESSPEE